MFSDHFNSNKKVHLLKRDTSFFYFFHSTGDTDLSLYGKFLLYNIHHLVKSEFPAVSTDVSLAEVLWTCLCVTCQFVKLWNNNIFYKFDLILVKIWMEFMFSVFLPHEFLLQLLQLLIKLTELIHLMLIAWSVKHAKYSWTSCVGSINHTS